MRVPTLRALACAILLTTVMAGCNSILDSSQDPPDEAEVTITGTSPAPLRLVLSSRFIGIWNPDQGKYDVSLNAADTVEVTSLPVTRTHRLNETGVFFVRLTNPAVDQTATIVLRVRIDGREVYSQAANMRDASLEYVFFTD